MDQISFARALLLRLSEKPREMAFSIYDRNSIVCVSAGQFVSDVLRRCAYFRANEIAERKVALLAPNSYEWVVTFFAIMASGNRAVLLNPEYPDDFILRMLRQSDAEYVISDSPLSDEYRKLGLHLRLFEDLRCVTDDFSLDDVHEAEPDETLAMLCTSGTTGKSKVVELSSRNLLATMGANYRGLENAKEERWLLWLPFTHMYTLCWLYVLLWNQVPIYMSDDDSSVFSSILKINPHVIVCVPSFLETVYDRLRKDPEEKVSAVLGNRIKRIQFAGAKHKAEAARFLLERGIELLSEYGLTEVSGMALQTLLDEKHLSSSGRACDGIGVRILNDEIVVSGASVMKGYYKDPEETAKVIDSKGYFHTGDLGYCDKDGYFYITGRKKNVIILSNGENVNPEEIEEVFSECKAVLECLAYGAECGICMDVFTTDQESVERFCRKYNRSVAAARRVSKVNYLEQPLEKTASGKIKRKGNYLGA